MVEAEVPPPAETAVDEAPAETVVETSEVSLKAPKRLPRPDREALNSQTDSLADEIKRYKNRVADINVAIKKKLEGNRNPEQDKNRKAQKNLQKEFEALLEQKNKCRGDLGQCSEKRKKLRDETREMRSKNAACGSGFKIDDQISELEKRHAHSSMSLTDEKKLLADIEKLKASRSASAAYDQRLKALDDVDKEADTIKDKMNTIDEEIARVKARQVELMKEKGAMQLKAEDAAADVQTLINERDHIRNIVKVLYDKIVELRNVYREELAEFNVSNEAWKKWRDADRKRKDAQWQKEKAEIDKARQTEDAYVAGEFFHEEVGYCDQLTAYLSKFVVADAATGPATAAATAEAATIDGYKVYKRKDEDADSVFGLSSAKKGSKKNKKGGKTDQPAEQKLVHSIDNLKAFTKLNVEMPLTSSKVPATLEIIKARKAYYLDKRAKKQESGEVPKRNSAATENGGTANGHAGTSGKGGAVANGDVDMSPESVLLKTTVDEDGGSVTANLVVTGEAFPSLH